MHRNRHSTGAKKKEVRRSCFASNLSLSLSLCFVCLFVNVELFLLNGTKKIGSGSAVVPLQWRPSPIPEAYPLRHP